MNKISTQIDGQQFTDSDRQQISRAVAFAVAAHGQQKRKSGEPYVTHPLAVAQILADQGLDTDTVVAAILHDTVEDTETTYETLRDEFGQTVADLVEGVTKLGQVKFVKQPADEASRQSVSAENIRKLLLAMTKDLRVILIKLADRLHNLQTLNYLPKADQLRIAEESLEIFAPVADRLGMGQVKGQLEDLAFRYVNPEAYEEIRAERDKFAKETSRYLAKLKRFIGDRLEEEGVEPIQVEGRQKHIYSIYKKLAKVEGDFSKIYDLVAIRIIVPNESDCYKTMGALHQHFKPLIHRIKDYIAVPKPNGYRSLHTTVFALNGKIIEIQIRTPRMHEEAERGLAAHFFYEEQKATKAYRSGKSKSVPTNLDWVKKLQDLQASVQNGDELVDALKLDLFEDRIFAFSPKGDLYDLPEGATPIDFAFAVHSDIGLKTVGAKVNGRIVPLDTRLENRDVVEILTKKEPAPNRDWLGFVKTAGARNKIRSWFRSTDKGSNAEQGKTMLEQNLKAWGYKRTEEIPKHLVQKLLGELPYKTWDDVLAAVGEGLITVGLVLRKLFPSEPARPKIVAKKPKTVTGKVLVAATPNLPYQLAACCNPSYPLPLVGYVTRGKGVTIHTRSCSNLPDDDPDRLVSCHWEVEGGGEQVGLKVVAENRIGLLRDITSAVTALGINITAIESRDIKARDEAEVNLEVEVIDLYVLAMLIKKLERLPGVTGVYRAK